MIDPHKDLPAVGAAFVVLCGACIVGLRAHDWRSRVQARVTAIARPHAPAQVAAPPVRGLVPLPAAELRRRVASVFGIVPGRPELQPLRPWILLPLALLLARMLCGVIAVEVGDVALLATPVAWVLLCRSFHNWAATRRTSALFRQFPDALAMIVRGVRVGIPVAEAIRVVAREAPVPTSSEFGRLADQLSVGVVLAEALQDLALRSRLPEYRFFATALTLQAQTGGGLSETLENLADVIRRRVAMAERGNALASEARTSSAILAALPVISGVALAVLNPSYAAVLVTEPAGRQLLVGACLLLGLGMLVMLGLIRKSLSQ
jgi:tight adherence protein B